VTGMMLLQVSGQPVAPGLKVNLTVVQLSGTAVAPPTPTDVGAYALAHTWDEAKQRTISRILPGTSI